MNWGGAKSWRALEWFSRCVQLAMLTLGLRFAVEGISAALAGDHWRSGMAYSLAAWQLVCASFLKVPRRPDPLLKEGDAVVITYGDVTTGGGVIFATQSGRSLVLVFPCQLGRFVGAMPVRWDDERFVDAFQKKPVKLSKVEHAAA